MVHATLFGLLAVMFALFAIAAARASQPVVVVPAAILSLWLFDGARHALRRRKRDQAA